MPGTPYTDEEKRAIILHVVSELSCGRSIAKIMREDKGMPDKTTFWAWHAQDEEIQQMVSVAREHGIEAQLDDAQDIADEVKPTMAEIQKAKLQCDMRVKMAQMLKPKKYGPKLDLTSAGEKIALSAELEAARRRASEGEDDAQS